MSYSFTLSKTTALVYDHALEPADVVVVKNKSLGVLDHYMVFVGWNNWGQPDFIANLRDETQWLPFEEIDDLSYTYGLSRIRRFNGTEAERRVAVQRAMQAVGEPYRFFGFNCEHFANWVQYGKATSQQVALGGIGLATTGAVIAAKSENKWVQALGGIAFAFGVGMVLKEL